MKKHTKRKLFSIAIILICLSIIGTGTLAYFSDSITVNNTIEMGNIDIALQGGGTNASYEDMMPGDSINESIIVENIGTGTAWVRVKVVPSITLSDGTVGVNCLDIPYNIGTDSNRWTKDGEYYYYNQALAPGFSTTPLFQTVTFPTSMGNEYQNSTAQVNVFIQAVQKANNGRTALEAAGWPE